MDARFARHQPAGREPGDAGLRPRHQPRNGGRDRSHHPVLVGKSLHRFRSSPTNLIGQITGATIPSNNSVVFQCPNDWVPIEVNGGHECLVVEASIPVFDPLTDPMQPVDDRHVGQKNEQLLTLPAGQSFKFKLSAHNFTAADQQVVVEARPRRHSAKLRAALRDTRHVADGASRSCASAARGNPRRCETGTDGGARGAR